MPLALWTTCYLDLLVVVKINGVWKPIIEHFSGSIPPFLSSLSVSGEAAVVKTKRMSNPKADERGTTCVFVGYCLDQEPYCYLMYEPCSNAFNLSRDNVWLKIMEFKDSGIDVLVYSTVVVSPPKKRKTVKMRVPQPTTSTKRVVFAVVDFESDDTIVSDTSIGGDVRMMLMQF